MQIDDFRPADQVEVRELVLAGLGDHWGSVDATRCPDLDDIAASYGHGRTVVIRDGGAIIATGTIVPRGLDALVVRMSVHRAARRRGLGRAVLDELVVTAQSWGVARIVLETTSTWVDAIAFYERNGFSVTHTTSGDGGCDTWFAREL